MRGHGGQSNRSSLGEGFRMVEDIPAYELCSDLLACAKASDKKNTFEIDLIKTQNIERDKRNAVKQK